ncbi:MAG: hypothetical protein WBA57_10135 [Elainellaceae cyanobacterium]
MTSKFLLFRAVASVCSWVLLTVSSDPEVAASPLGRSHPSVDDSTLAERVERSQEPQSSAPTRSELIRSSPLTLAQSLNAEDLELDPEILNNSPVLQRWLEEPPDVLHDIRHDPAFRPRIRAGYTHIDDSSGYYFGVEDLLLGELGTSGLALSADYANEFEGDRPQWGADLRYYLLPLGSRVNLAPQVGYRSLATPGETVDGVSLGGRLMLIPARTAAVDFSLTQVWINPGGESDVASLTTLSSGYALTQTLRLSTDIQLQLTPDRQDYRVGVGLELLF